MSVVLVLAIAIVVLCLLWMLIGYLPDPPVNGQVKRVLQVLLILAAVVWLAQRFRLL